MMESTATMNFSALDRYFGFKTPVLWENVAVFGMYNLIAVYSLFTVLPKARYATMFMCMMFIILAGIGITVGVHRLWTHRSYNATPGVRVMLMICFMFAGQYSMAQWVRDHRTHHRYSDTDADPHSINRGFFYAHMGWFLMKRHPEHKDKGKGVDISDVLADPVVQFQQKYFLPLLIFCHGIFPSAIAYFLLGENLRTCILMVLILRHCLSLHGVWCLNSVTHKYGYRPYNKNICASQNELIAILTLGEGWHNFHHMFPWDYRLGEIGSRWKIGCSIIDTLAWLGLAYDLKYATPELVQRVLERNQKGEMPHMEEYPELGLKEDILKNK